VLLITAALAWVGLLRKRVKAQTQVLVVKTVQLQEANCRTSEALQKAHEAGSLERDGKHVLELVARDEPIDRVIDQIAEAVAVHTTNAVCAILLEGPQGRRVHTVPAIPAGWQQAMEQIDVSSMSFGTESLELKHFSRDAAWTLLS